MPPFVSENMVLKKNKLILRIVILSEAVILNSFESYSYMYVSFQNDSYVSLYRNPTLKI